MHGPRTLLVALLALALVVLSSLVSAREWLGARQLTKAREEQKRGDINGARECYLKALELGEEEAALELARMALYRGDLEEVKRYAARAMEADPAAAYAHLLLASALASGGRGGEGGDAEAARAECRTAVSLEPTAGYLWKSCADLLLRLAASDERSGEEKEERRRRREETLRAYRQALRLNPGRAGETLRLPAEAFPDPSFLPEAVSGGEREVVFTAAALLHEAGKWEASRAAWWQVGRASAVPGTYALAAAEALASKGWFEEAREAFRAAVESAPEDDRAWFGLGRTAERLGDRSEAERSYRRAAELRRDNSAYLAALSRVKGRSGE